MNAALQRRRVGAAVAFAREYGVATTEAEVLHDGANVIARLLPSPVVARIASTAAEVRSRPIECLARDVAVTSFCARSGAAVVPPSREVPPGPHVRGEFVFTFSEYVEHERGREAEPEELGRALADLHAVLANYDGPPLPFLSPALDDALDVLDVLDRRDVAPAGEIAALRDAVLAARPALDASTLPVQALHGDAHRRNALCTERGIVWNDFEDTCAGPIAFDLACLGRRSGPASIAAYEAARGDRPTDAELAPFVAARAAQGAVWALVWRLRDDGRLS